MRTKRLFKKSNKKVMKFRPALFWDVDPKTISPQKHARYIIERVLELGNDKEVGWVFHYYPKPFIKDTFERSRGVICDKSKALWSLVLR